ncbi:PREDICTED: heme transporter hrg1-B-like, partial [Eufriesea mexicana]|uniref:heme transporter hrg1-B-like n=1 Tax=Eufriesea mexicana TaxID=516756 RepID=UPI00083BE564
ISATGIIVAMSAFIVFCVVYNNYHVGFWSILSGILAAICFHLHWLKGKERLERWYSKTILRKLNIIGFLSAVAGITALIWYLFVTLYYKIPITPFETSTAISAVWGTVCGQWGIFLMYYAHKYELIIEENSEPILTESNA